MDLEERVKLIKFKIIKGFEDYFISPEGTIFSCKYGKSPTELKQGSDKHGYKMVRLYRNGDSCMKKVHRLVAQAYLEEYDENLQVNHKNGVKWDNCLENLEMVTSSENHRHAFKIGLKDQKGEKNNASKLSAYEVTMIRFLVEKAGINQKDIAKLFGVSKATVCNIINYKTWGHI